MLNLNFEIGRSYINLPELFGSIYRYVLTQQESQLISQKDRIMAESAFPPAILRPLLEEVSSLLKERKETVSVAETVFSSVYQFDL